MRTLKTEAARWLIVCGMLWLLPMNGHALAARAHFDLDGAIRTGDFGVYYANLSAWLTQKVPANPGQISTKTMKALLRDPVFVAALAQRQFMARVWGSLPGVENLGAFAKAGPKNKEFLAWLMRKPAVMDTVLLTRTPSAMFAREDYSWSIEAYMLDTWKKIYYADPESRQGLYLRLAIATALRPPGTGNRGAGMQKKPSDPLVRYMHFKKAHTNQELLPSFDNLTAWELTHVVSSCASEKDLAWGREMVRTFIPDLLKGEQVVGMTSPMRYQGSQIPYNDFSCVLAGGGKCGPRSSFGVFINQAFGEVRQRQDLRPDEDAGFLCGEESALGLTASAGGRHEHQAPAETGAGEGFRVGRQDARRLAASGRSEDEFDRRGHGPPNARAAARGEALTLSPPWESVKLRWKRCQALFRETFSFGKAPDPPLPCPV